MRWGSTQWGANPSTLFRHLEDLCAVGAEIPRLAFSYEMWFCQSIGLHAALDYLDAIGRIWEQHRELGEYAYAELSALKRIRIFGPKTGRAGLVSFLLNGIHAHDMPPWRISGA